MHKLLSIFLLLFPLTIFAQVIKGKVSSGSTNMPLNGAYIQWVGSSMGTTTDLNGFFEINRMKTNNNKLVASHAGFRSDTMVIIGQSEVAFVLMPNQTLAVVIIQSQRDGIVIADLNGIKTEKITSVELTKSACCDLAGCFETQTTVQPQTTNIITNSKELRILGLSGVYNQVLLDGFPLIQGLSYTYGISSIPGSLVDNIYVAKGANSVLQGFESISGQINVETKEPDKTDRLLLNVYMNSFMEKHLNANYAFQKKKWSNLTAVHSIQPASKIDRDSDRFLDLPLLTRYMIYNKWKYGNDKDSGWNSQIGFRFYNEKRIGGQSNFLESRDLGSTKIYGQRVHINQPEWWTKTGYRFNRKQQLVFFISGFHQQQNSYFGTAKYDAKQTNWYTNFQYELNYGEHQLKTGISYRYLNFQEKIGFTDTVLSRSYDGQYNKQENIPGVFAENTLKLFDDQLTWIAGIRLDHHNQFGWQLTPRTLIKYDVAPKTIIRANAGTGWRTVNLFSENISLLASSRNIIFAEPLEPEKAFNWGVNLTQKFETNDELLSGYLSVDYYHTQFQNQVFPDYNSDPTLAIIKNFKGKSVSNGFQAELMMKWKKRFELKLGYNYLDVYRMVESEKQSLPFNPKHKILTTFSYKPLTNRFHVDMNIHWYGKQEMPDTRLNPVEFQRPNVSQDYTTANVQFTYNFKRLEVYTGCENIFDFRQLQPIISWQDPFGPYFDTSSVWGPTRGREIYVGVRYKWNKKSSQTERKS